MRYRYIKCTKLSPKLGNQFNNTTSGNNLLLSQLRDKSGLDDDGNLRQNTLTQHLAVTVGKSVDDGGGGGRSGLQVLLLLVSGNQRPQLLQVDLRSPEVVSLLVEVSHTNLTEVTGVVLVHVGSVVVLTTSHTTTTRVLSVLADSTLTGRNVATVLAGLSESSRHSVVGQETPLEAEKFARGLARQAQRAVCRL